MQGNNINSPADDRRHLKRKVFAGLSWQTTNTLVRQILTFLTGVILARMLTPADFGLINMAVIATTWVGILGDLGIEASLIQRSSLDEEEIDAGFWIAGGVGLLSATTMFLISPLLGRFYGSQLLKEMLYVYSLSLLLGGLNIVPAALLRRSLDFRSVAKVEISGTLASGCVAVILVALGVGPVSIPWGGAAGLFFSMIVYQRLGVWRVRQLPTKQRIKRVARFSSFLAGSKAMVLIRVYIDNAMIGKFLGAQSLGYYSLGYNLISVPEYRVVGLVTSIAFPALSTFQKDPREIGKAYLRILKYTSAVVMPLLVGLMIVSDRVIPLVYGPNWLPAVPIIQILSCAGLGTAIFAIADSPMLALGLNRTIFLLNLLWAVILAAAVLLALAVSPTLISVAYVVAAVALAMAFTKNFIASKSCGVRLIEVLSAFSASVISTFFMVLTIVTIDIAIPSTTPNWIQTGVVCIMGAVVYVIVSAYFFSELLSTFIRGVTWLKSRF